MSPDENRASQSPASTSNGATAWWVAIGVLAAIAIAMYAWKVVAVNQAEERLETESRQALEERTRTLLRLSGEPLGLAVRDAAMAENYGTVGSYLDRVARVEGVRNAVLAVGDTVRVSTDATQVGRPLAAFVPEGLAANETRVELTEEGAYHVSVPITGLNERIGSLVLTWVPPDAGEAGPAPADTTAGE